MAGCDDRHRLGHFAGDETTKSYTESRPGSKYGARSTPKGGTDKHHEHHEHKAKKRKDPFLEFDEMIKEKYQISAKMYDDVSYKDRNGRLR